MLEENAITLMPEAPEGQKSLRRCVQAMVPQVEGPGYWTSHFSTGQL